MFWKSWNDLYFEKTSLKALGYVLQMGHGSRYCSNPQDKFQTLTVIDTTGIHAVNVRWCECGGSPGGSSRRVQLLRMSWFPTTAERPRTVVTFDALDFFHLLTLQAKTTFYDFYETLAKRIDNSGVQQYPVSMISQYCFKSNITFEGSL